MPDIAMRCGRCQRVLATAVVTAGPGVNTVTLPIAVAETIKELAAVIPCQSCDGAEEPTASARLALALHGRMAGWWTDA